MHIPDTEIPRFVRLLHAAPSDTINIDTRELDKLVLGGVSSDIEAELITDNLDHRYPGEKPWYGRTELVWTKYEHIKQAIRAIRPTEDDVFYDLGSGYGRVVLYAGMVTTATCKGIELVEERAKCAAQAGKRLQLGNVSFAPGNISGQDFSDGNVFYLYYPFSPKTAMEVVARLALIADAREASGLGPITIAAKISKIFKNLPWLRQVSLGTSVDDSYRTGIDYFQSIPKAERAY